MVKRRKTTQISESASMRPELAEGYNRNHGPGETLSCPEVHPEWPSGVRGVQFYAVLVVDHRDADESNGAPRVCAGCAILQHATRGSYGARRKGQSAVQSPEPRT
jgi:hypothetical protein